MPRVLAGVCARFVPEPMAQTTLQKPWRDLGLRAGLREQMFLLLFSKSGVGRGRCRLTCTPKGRPTTSLLQ